MSGGNIFAYEQLVEQKMLQQQKLMMRQQRQQQTLMRQMQQGARNGAGRAPADSTRKKGGPTSNFDSATPKSGVASPAPLEPPNSPD